ncbi:hypothetical protein GCM10018954_068200 [Kutzneria kofuensis]
MIRVVGSVAKAAATEARPNTVEPISSRVRRPMRSPMLPMVISRPARTKPYMSMIHSCSVPEGARAAEMAGMAKYRTVMSMETSSSGRTRTARPVHSRRPARRGGCVACVMPRTIHASHTLV